MNNHAEFVQDFQELALAPCKNCGRTFNPETLLKHEKICKKTASQRKVFESSKQRSVGGRPPRGSGFQSRQIKQPVSEPHKNSNWRQQHEEFLQTVRAARGVTAALRAGKELPPPPPPTINPNYIQCPHCSRRFNKGAADRHINFCADQHKRLETRMKGKAITTVKAAEKQDRRTSYRPPLPSSGTRRNNDVHSNKSGFSQSRQTAGKVSSATQGHSRARALGSTDRRNEDKPFDTRLPSNQVATTKTGLKAQPQGKYSSSGLASSNFNQHSIKRKDRELSYPSAGYASSSSARSISGRDPVNSAHKNRQQVGFEENEQYVSRKVSNLQERKKLGSSRSVGALALNGAENSLDPVTSWDTQRQQNFRRTFEKDGSHFVSRGNDDIFHELGNPSLVQGASVTESSKGVRSLFCHECGSRFPVSTAKFCCECGTRRMNV